MPNGPILLIDSLNLFSRHYCRNPAMSTHGHQAGGIVGFLKSLQDLVMMTAPSRVFIVWESGGSSRRRAVFPEYKQNRRPPKLNRYYEDDIPDSSENRLHQIKFLIEALKYVPVMQIFVEDCEADDVIGFLCRNKLKGEKKIIVSSDRDYYQLLDDFTMIYSLSSKKFMGAADVVKQFNISPVNFVLAKALNGDASDGIPGVKGVGFKTIAKRFDLNSDKEVTVDELLKFCAQDHEKATKFYKKIIDNESIIKRNIDIMYLDTANLAAVQMKKINVIADSSEPKKNKMKFMKLLIDEGLGTFDTDDFFAGFPVIT